MRSLDVCIHVGIRKSGTTWLQNRILSQAVELNYLGKTRDNYPQWLKAIHYADDFEFPRRVADVKSEVNRTLAESLTNVISSEAFTNTGVISQQVGRIGKCLPSPRIIITLRDPIAALVSHYRMDVLEGSFFGTFESYLEWSSFPRDLVKRRRMLISDFFYSDMIDLYAKEFGEENVLVLKLEDLEWKPRKFLAELSGFLRAPSIAEMFDEVSTRENVGIRPDEIPPYRRVALLRFLKDVSPNFSETVSESDLGQDFDEEILTSRLRERLVQMLEGRTFGYY